MASAPLPPHPRAHRTVRQVHRTVELERDSPAYNKLLATLQSSGPCELRATVTAERLLASGPAGPAATSVSARNAEARFIIGELRIDLRALLASGSDVVEQSLPLLVKGRQNAAAKASRPPRLIISLEALASLAALARAARLPIAPPTDMHSRATFERRTGPAVAERRLARLVRLQAQLRGHLTRRAELQALEPEMASPSSRVEALVGMEHVRLSVTIAEVRQADSDMAELLLSGEQEMCLELDAAELSSREGHTETHRSLWTPLPLPPHPASSALPLSLMLDLRHGGRARSCARPPPCPHTPSPPLAPTAPTAPPSLYRSP